MVMTVVMFMNIFVIIVVAITIIIVNSIIQQKHSWLTRLSV